MTPKKTNAIANLIGIAAASVSLCACSTTQSTAQRQNEILVDEINKRTQWLNLTIGLLDYQNKEVFRLRKKIAELKEEPQ